MQNKIEKGISKEAAVPKYNLKNLHVIQRNDFVRSPKPEFTTLESKLTRFLIAQILKQDDDFLTYSVDVSKLASLFNVPKSTVYSELNGYRLKTGEEHLPLDVRLMNLPTITIYDGTFDKRGTPNRDNFHWYDKVSYRNGVLTLRLSNSLRDFLIDVKKQYTDYNLMDCLSLPNDNSIRMYELLCSWYQKSGRNDLYYVFDGIELRKNQIYYEIEFLKKYFNSPDTYTTSNFIRKIIKPSIEALNKGGLFPCGFTEVKNGDVFKNGNKILDPDKPTSKRKIYAIIFTIKGYTENSANQ